MTTPENFADALTFYNDTLAAWISACHSPLPVDDAEWEARADAARNELVAAHEAAVEAARRDARPIPPALSAAEAEALVDALDSAARHRGHMDHEMFADSGRAASAANVAAARAAIIAALTGREGGAA